MEIYPPVIPNPPPRFSQEHDAPLGSLSAGPAYSYQQSLPSHQRYHNTIDQPRTSSTINEGEVGSGYTLLYLPSSSQQAALTALQDYDNSTIFAWLTVLRSFRSGAEKWFRPGSLTPQQLEALSALKDCSDSLISAWLDSTRRSGQYLCCFLARSKSSNVMAQGILMRFKTSTETATSMSRELR